MDFKKILASCGVDSLVFVTDGPRVDANFYYFAGLSKAIQVTSTIIVTKKGPIAITNRLEERIFGGKKIVIESRSEAESAMRKHTGKTIGVDYSSISAARLFHFRKFLKGRKIIDVSGKMNGIRAVKAAPELKKVREACRMTEEILNAMEKLVKRSVTEKDLADEIAHAARRNGAEDISFPPIAACGKNSAIPHHVPGNAKLKGMLLVDFGIVHQGYCSDLTRMFYIGKADEKAKRIYGTVHSAQAAAIAAARSGAKAKDVHIAADDIIKKNFKQSMIHSVGHGLGIEVHEYPGVSEKSPATLARSMVITIEPGYYKKGWGGVRIEDDVVVGKKAILLSKAPARISEI